MEWHSIDTAPKDGRTINVKRLYKGSLIYQGPAAWRTVRFPALPSHPLDGDVYAPAEDATGWMYPDVDKRVPEPTHWRS